MTDRRPHWTDDLIDAVAACLDTSGDDISFDTYAAIAAVEDWARWEHVPKGTLLRLERAEAAIARVRELHYPIPGFNGEQWCGAHCEATVDGDPTQYPCETIRALDGER